MLKKLTESRKQSTIKMELKYGFFIIIKMDTYLKMLKQIKWKSRVIRKEMRQYITYLKNGLDLNLNDSFIFILWM